MRNLVITALQLATSIARLAAFAFAVLTLGRVADSPQLSLVIGYLPYLSFFDTLIQSGSRAMFLRGSAPRAWVARLRSVYAIGALALLGSTFTASLTAPALCTALIIAAWPFGAIGFVWERLIAGQMRQLLLALVELTVLATAVGTYLAGIAPWQALLLCIASFPVARLVVLAVPMRQHVASAPETPLTDVAGIEDTPAALGGWRIGGYIGTSLVQQIIAASAGSLPAIWAQATGDWHRLPMNVAIFRSLHSLAAVVSLTINAMSSRIFYRQTGAGFETFEARVLAFSGKILSVMVAITSLAALVAIVLPRWPAAFSFTILPIMAMINAESSMLYNRGLPLGTMHCQILILLLSLAFLLVLVHHTLPALVVLALFIGYVFTIIPAVLQSHRRILASKRAS